MGSEPKIPIAPRHPQGYLQARPGDVIGRDDLIIVDVRPEPDLLGELGHIHGVLLAPADRLMRSGLPRAAREPVVLVCNDGRLSQRCAVALVRDHGCAEVYHLVGGMVRWNAEERPVARRPTWQDPP